MATRRGLWATGAASFLGISVFYRAFSSDTGEDKIAAKVKTLFPGLSVKLTLKENRVLSIDEEKVNEKMKNWNYAELNRLFDEHKADPKAIAESKSKKKFLIRTFTLQAADGSIISGANLYLIDKKGKRKLVKTLANEIDEKGNIIKPFEGEVMLTDDLKINGFK